jgi:hypothetical protein
MGIEHRGEGIRAALAGEQPVKQQPRLVLICGWCPDAPEQTASARAHGFDVSHGMCAACAKKFAEEPPR